MAMGKMQWRLNLKNAKWLRLEQGTTEGMEGVSQQGQERHPGGDAAWTGCRGRSSSGTSLCLGCQCGKVRGGAEPGE